MNREFSDALVSGWKNFLIPISALTGVGNFARQNGPVLGDDGNRRSCFLRQSSGTKWA